MSRLPGMITRRTFMHTGALASAAFALPQAKPAPRYKLGLQMFTVRAPMARDAEGTLKSIAAMGYQELETYGFDPQALSFYGMPAKTFAERLKALNLTAVSGHYDLNRYVSTSVDDLKRYVDKCIEGAKAIGQSYVTWPFLDPDSRTLDKFKVVAERLNIAGAQCKKAGLQFAYHNHDFEFVEQDGRIGYDIILAETDPDLVKLQMDLYWIARASKQPPHYWFTRAPGRFVMWHVKDMHKVSRDYTELGNGTIDYTRIWPDAAMSGMTHFFVEQGGNFAVNAMQSAEDGMAYVKKYLKK